MELVRGRMSIEAAITSALLAARLGVDDMAAIQLDDRALFLNHTLWNREGDRIFFFVRADFNDPKRRVNIPMTVKPDAGCWSAVSLPVARCD